MSAKGQFLASALMDAKQPGPECVPIKLLSIADQPDPIHALSTIDGGNELFGALTEDYGFLEIFRLPNPHPSEELRTRLVGLLRWIMRSLREWDRASDPNNQLLVAFFVISRYCRNADAFWTQMPDEIANETLVKELAAILRRIQIDISSDEVGRNPLSSQQAIENFIQADRNADWLGLIEGLRSFPDFPDTFVSEVAGYLHRFDRKMLIETISSTRQTLTVMRILEALAPVERCQLSLDTNNSHLDFGVIYRCLIPNRWRQEPEAIPPLLANVLRKVAADDERWKQCMVAFNSYPMRYPALAPFLGEALADISDAAVTAYVHSISLIGMSTGSRQTVADALMAFYSCATEERRKLLWCEGFKRWEKWKFGDSENNNLATRIGSSELDFAVVGFAVECMSQQEREAFYQNTCTQLSLLELDWHTSHLQFLAKKNHLLSEFQPVAHAMQVSEPSQWLATVTYLPFDKKNDRYAALLLGV